MAAFVPVLGTESVSLFGHVLASRAFAIGLLFGAFAFFATGGFAAVRRTTTDGAGIAFAAALVLSVRDVYGARAAPIGFIAGLVHDPSWVRLAMGAGVLIAGPLVHDFDAAQGPRGAPFLLLMLAAVAVYYTVPDTELPLVMIGCTIPLALLSIPQPLRRLGPAGSTAAVGAFMWVVAVGGRGRGASAVAAFATLGLLLVEPLARRVPRSNVALGKKRRQRSRQTDNWLLVIGVAAVAQLALGFYCAKFVGRGGDSTLAAIMALPALVLVGAAAPVLLPVLAPGRRPVRPKSKSRSGSSSRSGSDSGSKSGSKSSSASLRPHRSGPAARSPRVR
jgi:hypothetical protein